MMHGGKTGYPAGLLQDDHTKLSKWFASKPDARMIVRQVCKEILEKKHDLHLPSLVTVPLATTSPPFHFR
jgi:hypothetical protein